MLGVPVIGMAIAFVIIYWKKPNNMIMALAVIFFLAVQYVLMMFFWMKRVETLAKREEKIEQEHSDDTDTNVENLTSSENVLKPEEERVFPVNSET
jgi:F0F1-type ATP synthase membrane subunit b/b'